MSASPRILVTGAAGKTGAAVVRALLENGNVQVRALVRVDDDRARRLRDAGAETVVGNMDDFRDMQRAMSGVQRAYFVAPVTANSLDHAMNFAIAANEARLEHVVALGQWLSSPNHPSVGTRRTWLTDQLFAWIPDVEHTIINVGWFADNYMLLLGIAAQLGVFPLPFSEGKNAPISNEDIGRVVAGVLVNPAPYAGRTLRPTGPELLSPQQVADAFGEVLGRKVRHVDISDRMFGKASRALGLLTPFTHAQMVHYVRDYRRGSFALGGPTDVVEQVTGRPAEDFISIVSRYAASDPTARRSIRNTLRALAQMVRIVVTPPINLKRWEKEQGMPHIRGAEGSIDADDWRLTHGTPNAFGVSHGAGGSPSRDAGIARVA